MLSSQLEADRRTNVSFWSAFGLLWASYVLVRIIGLDTFVTTDEQRWLARSAGFYEGLSLGNLELTYQMAHPGVTTMWAGAVAFFLRIPNYAHELPAVIGPSTGIDTKLRMMGHEPMDMLVAARISKVVLQSLFLVTSLEFIRRLFGRKITIVAGILIVMDPFLSGHDSLLQIDGIVSITAFTAVLALAYASNRGFDSYRPWMVAGAFAALAWLSRVSAAAIVPAVLIALAVSASMLYRTNPQQGVLASMRLPIRAAVAWGIGAAACTVIIWPALWIDPLTVTRNIWDFVATATGDGHEHSIYYRGDSTRGDPGADFYLVTMLWRLSPVSYAGLVLFAAAVATEWRKRGKAIWSLGSIGIIGLFAILYFIGMSASAKKFDRYILPVYPILALFAAIGFVYLAAQLTRWWPSIRRASFGGVVAAVLVFQGAATWSVLPYRLDYFNPLLGGGEAAMTVLPMGWGEGADKVLDYLEEQVSADETITFSSSNPNAFTYMTPDNLKHVGDTIVEPRGWYESDYYARNIQQLQRSSFSTKPLDGYEPVYTATINGITMWRVWKISDKPLPDLLRETTGCSTDFGEDLRLLQIESSDDRVEIYWISDAMPAGTKFEIQLTLVDETGAASSSTLTASMFLEEPGFVSKSTILLDDKKRRLPEDQIVEVSVADFESNLMRGVAAVDGAESTKPETASTSPATGVRLALNCYNA